MKSIIELKKDLFELGEGFNKGWYYLETKDKINMPFYEYDQSSNKMILLAEVQGTQYEGRNPRIENIKINDKVLVKREPNNKYNNLNLSVLNDNNESLGNLSVDVCNVLSPLLDKKIAIIDSSKAIYVEPLSKRSSKCKKSLLTIKLQIHFEELETGLNKGSIICILGGDQTRIWAQELSVIKCSIPLQEAKLLFEIYNRFNDEYNNENLDYFGLDNLCDEVTYARERMKLEKLKDFSYEKIYESDNFLEYLKTIIQEEKNRYSTLEKYIPNEKFIEDDFYSLKDIIYEYALDEKKYYWFEQCRVSKAEYEKYTGYGFNHWYEIAELYRADCNLPFDLNDEDIVSIFGFEKFEAFGDLSYGC